MAKRAKRMATFRLTEKAISAIKAIADEREMSQAEVIEWLVGDYGNAISDGARREWSALEKHLRDHMAADDLKNAILLINAINDRTTDVIGQVEQAGRSLHP